jgi:hypothetical protein
MEAGLLLEKVVEVHAVVVEVHSVDLMADHRTTVQDYRDLPLLELIAFLINFYHP